MSTARDFARLMGAIIADTLSGVLSPDVANAAVNAGGKLLKVVEMQHKYGRPVINAVGHNGRSLVLVESDAMDAAA